MKHIKKLVHDFDRIRPALLISLSEFRTELATAEGSSKLDRPSEVPIEFRLPESRSHAAFDC